MTSITDEVMVKNANARSTSEDRLDSQAVIPIAPHCAQSLKPALLSEKSELNRRPCSLINRPSRLSSSPAPFDPEYDLPFTVKVSYPHSKSNSSTLILLP